MSTEKQRAQWRAASARQRAKPEKRARKAAHRGPHHRHGAAYGVQLEAQGGVCAICKRPPTKNHLSWDHNHNTGAKRELLCTACNSALGMAQDAPAILRAMADYLERHG